MNSSLFFAGSSSFRCIRQSRSFLLCRLAFLARSLASFLIPASSFLSRSFCSMRFFKASATDGLRCKKLSSSLARKSCTKFFMLGPPSYTFCEPSFVLSGSQIPAPAPLPKRLLQYWYVYRMPHNLFIKITDHFYIGFPECLLVCSTLRGVLSVYKRKNILAIIIVMRKRYFNILSFEMNDGITQFIGLVLRCNRSSKPFLLTYFLPLKCMARPAFR
jgi:hypothetical protein